MAYERVIDMALKKAATKYGLVSGVQGNNPSFTVFKGIPYARPPVGEYRFRAPVDPEPWEGELVCDRFAPAVIQELGSFGIYQKEFYPEPKVISEDSLYLNVWTPAGSENEKLPVMMWIHGGGYGGGYSYEMEFDGEAMCKRGCILVSIAYRCGTLGFFAHPKLSERCPMKVSGNYGMLDQIQALKWTRENIGAFGGDPDNITIFGQSAGGMSVQSLLASHLCRGMFKRAIVQSAGGLNDLDRTRTMAEKEQLGEKVLAELGWTFEELFTRPAVEVSEKIFEAARRISGTILPMQPCVDGYALNDSPGKCIAKGDIPEGVSIMTGSVSGDGGLFARGIPMDDPNREELVHIASYSAPAAWAKAYALTGRDPIYTYYFSRNLPGDNNGAFHSAELWYVFGTLFRCWRPFKGYDFELSNMMADYWTNFAKTGNPNGEGLPAWPVYTSANPLTMCFADDGIEARNIIKGGLDEKLIDAIIANSGISLP